MFRVDTYNANKIVNECIEKLGLVGNYSDRTLYYALGMDMLFNDGSIYCLTCFEKPFYFTVRDKQIFLPEFPNSEVFKSMKIHEDEKVDVSQILKESKYIKHNYLNLKKEIIMRKIKLLIKYNNDAIGEYLKLKDLLIFLELMMNKSYLGRTDASAKYKRAYNSVFDLARHMERTYGNVKEYNELEDELKICNEEITKFEEEVYEKKKSFNP